VCQEGKGKKEEERSELPARPGERKTIWKKFLLCRDARMMPPFPGENIGVAFSKIYATIPRGKTNVCVLHTEE
jgi:hypothetical protein